MARLVEVGRRAVVRARAAAAGKGLLEWTAFQGLLVGLSAQGGRAVDARARARARRRATGKTVAQSTQAELPFQSLATAPEVPPRTDPQRIPKIDWILQVSRLRDLAPAEAIRALLAEGWEPAEVAHALARALGLERLRRELQLWEGGRARLGLTAAELDEVESVRAIVDAGTRPGSPGASRPGSSLADAEGATASALSDVARLDSDA